MVAGQRPSLDGVGVDAASTCADRTRRPVSHRAGAALRPEFGGPREGVQGPGADPGGREEARSPQDDDQDVALPQPGLAEEVARTYGDGMRRGAILLAAWVDDDHADRALATYREYGA